MLKQIRRFLCRNPFDELLSRSAELGQKNVLAVWNRGLGDIPLGLYAFVHRIRSFLPDAKITFLTRLDLREGFALLENVEILVSPQLKRGVEFDLKNALIQLGRTPEEFDLIIPKPDPTNWLRWQIGELIPRLHWDKQWDPLHERFSLPTDRPLIGVHVQTETVYQYEKNWPLQQWSRFFDRARRDMNANILLFGFEPTPHFSEEGIIDLRGKTTFLEMMSIIKNCCTHLVVPDSGVLSITYYLDVQKPLKIVSLWADPRQGVLRQKVASPNRALLHYPLVGKGKDIARIPVDAVLEYLNTCQRPHGLRSF